MERVLDPLNNAINSSTDIKVVVRNVDHVLKEHQRFILDTLHSLHQLNVSILDQSILFLESM